MLKYLLPLALLAGCSNKPQIGECYYESPFTRVKIKQALKFGAVVEQVALDYPKVIHSNEWYYKYTDLQEEIDCYQFDDWKKLAK